MIFCCCGSVLASEKINGTFKVTNECDAYRSFRRKSDPVKVKIGESYQAVAVNKAEDWEWIGIFINNDFRWVSKKCGIAEIDKVDMSPPLASNRRLESHVWRYLKKFGAEPINYATYSYILVGRDGLDKYAELVSRIRRSTTLAEEMAESKTLQPEELNIFLIPAINTDGSSYKPDYELSKSLLAVIDARSKLSFDRPGPYIITLYQPISTLQKNSPVVDMLYVDLTNINKGVIAELVRTYKQTVLKEQLDGLNKLSSLRLSLLNLAFMTEESIGFAKTASASLQPIFPDSNK